MKCIIPLLFAQIRNLSLTIGSILLKKKEIEIHSLSAKKSPSSQFPIGAKVCTSRLSPSMSLYSDH